MPIEALSVLTFTAAIIGTALAAAVLFRVRRLNPASEQHALEASLVRLEQGLRDEFARGRQESAIGSKLAREETAANAKALREEVQLTLKQMGEQLGGGVTELRRTVEGRLDALRSENAEKLEQMRLTVDEKLQGTLDQRFTDQSLRERR